MSRPPQSETGQATPLYITTVVGLLFVALAFFAFGQADVVRNGAQSAADAAALAAAQESRDQLRDDFLSKILDDGYLEGIFDGNVTGPPGCGAAGAFAASNEAQVTGCASLNDGRWGVMVSVRSQDPVGDTVLSGTESMYAEAEATAVVEPRCAFEPNEDAGEPPDGGEEGGDEKPSPGTFVCDGKPWIIDPTHLDLLPDMNDLFAVRLAED
ncbi:pilus assembly protein TadG-related protein [Streptomyces sp. NPDC006923]|uniref:pilus assembly protein TadG-related protein n=1 Tax=Streptomyces sp. NPDC006923 TaxID=3155355 RepID=UPI0033D76FA9